jgi:dipeptide transport system substrate-binding protein
MKKVSTLLIACLLVFGSALAGCSQGSGSGSGNKFLMYNNLREPTSLDPPIGFDQASYDILNNAMEGLTRLDKDHNPQAAAAKEWTISPDGKKYTFKLRDGLKWSNGKKLTAADFEYAWKAILDPKKPADSASLAYIIDGAEAYNSGKGPVDGVKVKALDEMTLEVNLGQPAPWLLGLTANPVFFPVSKEAVQANAKWATEASSFVGNGPFKITEWKHDAELKMVKNENYWDAKNVKLDGVVFKMVNDSNTEYQMYQSGDLHTAAIPADLSDKLFADGKVKVEDSAGTAYYRFYLTKPPFNNINIRKAFIKAVDYQKLVDQVTKRKEKPAEGFVSFGIKDPSGADFRKGSGKLVSFDAAEAKKLLEKGMAEAGYKTLPEVTLTTNTNDLSKKITVAMQAMFKENLGVDVKIETKETKVLTAEQKKLQLQLSRSSWLPDFADPINYLDLFVTDGSNNRTGYSNPNYDKLIKDAYNEPDNKKRFAMMNAAEKLLFDDAVIMPLYFYSSAYLQSDKVSGVLRHAFGYIDFKLADLK